MRLEPLFRLSMRYEDGVWARPFGAAEGAGFGWGDGTVSGETLEGNVRWSNFPRRREDGVWTPNLRGVITVADGAEILISLHGQSVQEESPEGVRRAILTRVELLSEHENYRWLNTMFVVGEGEIDEETGGSWIQAYVCINEVAQHAPAIGAPAPERYRQADP